ncbi:MAG: GNAT family N-acetyltransferase [Ruminococcus sp.]|nr:GNAT family N-acetyltransferase [Ruminococcus sp.]
MRELETQRLKLRHITEDDAERIFSCWASDPEVTRFVTWNAHTDICQTNDYVAYILKEYRKSDCYRWGIEIKETCELIGIIDVVGFHHGAPVIGYCSGRAYWGKGYMSEALEAVVDELFQNGFDTLVIEAVDDNIASNKVILKNGFKLVATRKAPISEQKPDTIVTFNSYRLYK